MSKFTIKRNFPNHCVSIKSFVVYKLKSCIHRVKLVVYERLSIYGSNFIIALWSQLVPLEELDEDMSIMGGREVVLEHRTLFR